jgi:hypothetical protein
MNTITGTSGKITQTSCSMLLEGRANEMSLSRMKQLGQVLRPYDQVRYKEIYLEDLIFQAHQEGTLVAERRNKEHLLKELS